MYIQLLEKKMATHSSILAWRITWTEEPGGLRPWGHKELDTTKVTSHIYNYIHRLPRWCSGKGSACQYRRHKRHGLDPRSGRAPGEGNGNSGTVAGKSHGHRSLVGYSP